MQNKLIIAFWNCGDNELIEFALVRARLNVKERLTLTFALDECMTQEQIAEKMGYSVRRVQDFWANATRKLLGISWVRAYARSLLDI